MEQRFKEILACVAFHYPMPQPRIMKLNSSRGEATLARYAVYKLLTIEGFTPQEIAAYFAVSSHYRINYALEKYESWIKIYPAIRTTYTRLESWIKTYPAIKTTNIRLERQALK